MVISSDPLYVPVWRGTSHLGVPAKEPCALIGAEFPRILDAAKAGHHSAIEAIYRDISPLVLGYLRSVGAVDPEDVTSEVFVSMMRGIASFEGDESHFRSWMLTIAHRRLTDAVRKSGRRREEPVPIDELGERMVVLSDTESEAMARLRSRGVLEAIDELTDDQRSVLMLRVLADLSVREIGAIVGKPETAVKALLRRGLASLGRRLSNQESDDDEGTRTIAARAGSIEQERVSDDSDMGDVG